MRYLMTALALITLAACATSAPDPDRWSVVACSGECRAKFIRKGQTMRLYDSVLADRYNAKLEAATVKANAGLPAPATPDESKARRDAAGWVPPTRAELVSPDDVCYEPFEVSKEWRETPAWKRAALRVIYFLGSGGRTR